MNVLKCRRCGGNLLLINETNNQERIAECESCGSHQIIPFMDDERKERMFVRANDLWSTCDFDRAAAMYDAIAAEYPNEAEAFWGQVLCKYGIEYVKDPATGRRIPTCHRVSLSSVTEDKSYNLALKNAGILAKEKYEADAAEIEQIRKGIIEISNKERPYDIFICYKETDEYGDRTPDSVMAQDVYEKLTEKGYRVFFSRITLEDKLGQEYEPYIFAALNSAKIMLVFGTQENYFQSVWVKNEWSRFLSMMSNGNKSLIACYKYISPYDLPHEFRNLQGLDMGKIGAIQDLLRGIDKIIPKKRSGENKDFASSGSAQVTIQSLLNRGEMALEDAEWDEALKIFEMILNSDPKCAEAYFDEILCDYRCKSIEDLFSCLTEKIQEKMFDSRNIRDDMTDTMRSELDQYLLPNYFSEKDLQRIINEFGNYDVLTPPLQKEMDEKMMLLNTDKRLIRAQKFAKDEFAKEIKELHSKVADAFHTAIEEAKKVDDAAFLNTWEKVLEEIKSNRSQAEIAREKDYQKAGDIPNDPSISLSLKMLEKVGDYKDATQKKEELNKLSSKIDEIQDGSKYFLNALIKDKRSDLQSYINTCRMYYDGKWDTGFSNGLSLIYMLGYSIAQIIIVISVFVSGISGVGSAITGFLNMILMVGFGLVGMWLGYTGFGFENKGKISIPSILGYIVLGFFVGSYNFSHRPSMAFIALILYLMVIPASISYKTGRDTVSESMHFYYNEFKEYEWKERQALNELWRSVLNRDIRMTILGVDTFLNLQQKTGIVNEEIEEYLENNGFDLGLGKDKIDLDQNKDEVNSNHNSDERGL